MIGNVSLQERNMVMVRKEQTDLDLDLVVGIGRCIAGCSTLGLAVP